MAEFRDVWNSHDMFFCLCNTLAPSKSAHEVSPFPEPQMEKVKMSVSLGRLPRACVAATHGTGLPGLTTNEQKEVDPGWSTYHSYLG